MTPALMLAAALGTVPFQREFRDWIGVCDNGRSCTLKAVPDEIAYRGSTGLNLTVTREAGPTGKLSLTVSLDGEGRLDPARLRLDGKPLAAPWTRDDTGASLEGAPALAAVRALREGRVLSVADGSKEPPGASLVGFAAALLAVDDVQGRVGGVTAAARPGPAPASTVPPPPPLPVIVAAPRPPPLRDAKALTRAVRRAKGGDLKAGECEADRAQYDEAQPLNATEAIVILDCRMAAYQGNSLVYRAAIATPSSARPIALPSLPTLSKDETSGNQFVDPSYEPDTATFESSSKGRGLGDCGVEMDWTYDGKAFRPSGVSEQQRCGGEAHDWPEVYRTKVTPPPKR